MSYWLLLLAGTLLCNGIPHLAAGVRGEPFPTPFATPSGIGLSSPLVNFLWASANLAAGAALMIWRLPQANLAAGLVVAALGWLASGCFLATHFAKVRAGRAR